MKLKRQVRVDRELILLRKIRIEDCNLRLRLCMVYHVLVQMITDAVEKFAKDVKKNFFCVLQHMVFFSLN